jgi:hypothetical protein
VENRETLLMSKRQQLHGFWQRPGTEKWLFMQAYFGLGAAWLAVRLLPFRWLAPHLGKQMTESPMEVLPEHVRFIHQVTWAVQRASELTPWPSVCLPQAITAKMLLRQRGLASTLYLGAAFDETRAFTAHAWLRCGPFYVAGGMGHRQYGMLASFAETEE